MKISPRVMSAIVLIVIGLAILDQTSTLRMTVRGVGYKFEDDLL